MMNVDTNLNGLTSSILKDLRYMCTQATEKSDLLLQEVEKRECVAKKLHTLIHRMRINLDTWEDQLYKIEAEIDKNESNNEEIKVDSIINTKKKINLSLKKNGDTQETDLGESKDKESVQENLNNKSVEEGNQEAIEYTPTDDSSIKIEETIIRDVAEEAAKESNSTSDLSTFDFECGVDDFRLLNREDDIASKLVEKSQQENNELLALLQANINDTQVSNESSKTSKEKHFDGVDGSSDSDNNDASSIHSSDLFFSDSMSDLSDLSGVLSSDNNNVDSDTDRPNVPTKNNECSNDNREAIIRNQPKVLLKCLSKCTDQEIDRLCDLNSINKRKCKKILTSTKKRRRIRVIRSSSSSSVSSIDSVSFGTQTDTILLDTDHPQHKTNEVDDMLANFLGDESSDDDQSKNLNIDDLSCDSDDETKTTKPVKKSKKIDDEADKKVIEIVDDDEEMLQSKRRSSAWKTDKLLRQHLWTSSDNDSSDSNLELPLPSSKRIKRENNAGTTQPNISKNNKTKNHFVEESTIISDSSNSSDSDDCRVVNEYQDEPGSIGRRNIRAIMTEDELDQATIEANREEDERVKRVESLTQVIEELQSQHSDFVLDIDTKTGKPLITVDEGITRTLKPHQKAGIRFMWEACFESVEAIKKQQEGTGCILAHCMGLGKTRQVIALIHTLFLHEITEINHVLIICPLSTVSNWCNEFSLVFGDQEKQCTVKALFLIKQDIDEKVRLLKKWRIQKGVLVMGYEAFERLTSSKIEDKFKYDIKRIDEALLDPGPDLIICDEGHLLKNGETRRNKALMRVKTKRRIVLTGTPLQNNLMEYYFMVHFVKPHLLGTCKEYKNRFANPILNGQYHDSGLEDIKIMKKRTHVLTKLLKRTIQRVESKTLSEYLPEIIDYTIYVTLNSYQIALYQKYIDLINVKGEKLTRMGFFHDFRMTNFICLHPYVLVLYYSILVKSKKIKEVETLSTNFDNIDNEVNLINQDWYRELLPEDVSNSIEYSTKFKIMMAVIDEAIRNDEKVLIFAHYLVELDAVEHFLKHVGTSSKSQWVSNENYFRMDGTIKPERRSELCAEFNSNPNVKIFLISHKVGGLGLNLTAANRVILLGTHYNPSHDTQSIYRAYRFGQTKPCFVYRLLTKGTMEEKIYQRCVVKLAVAGTVVDKLHLDRHYNSNDLRQMYHFDYRQFTERPSLSRPSDKLLASLIEQHVDIYSYLEHNSLLENKPDEELDDEDKKLAWEDFIKTKNNKTDRSTAHSSSQLVPNPMATLGKLPASRLLTLPPKPAASTSKNSKEPCIVDLTSNSVINGHSSSFGVRQAWNNSMTEPRLLGESEYNKRMQPIREQIANAAQTLRKPAHLSKNLTNPPEEFNYALNKII